MNKKKVETYIRFAIKCGSVIYGIDRIKPRINKIKIIIADKTLSDNSLKKAKLLSERYNIPFILSEDDINKVLNTSNCKIIGITNTNLADAILNNIGDGYFLAEGK
ncbi:MAG TPA: hypothetical protein VIL23_04335 [Clostridia bacterium]